MNKVALPRAKTELRTNKVAPPRSKAELRTNKVAPPRSKAGLRTNKVAPPRSKAGLRSKALPRSMALPRARAGTSSEAGRESVGPGRLAASKRTRKAGQDRPASRAAAAHDRPSPFLPIHVLAESTTVGVEIHLGGGRLVRVGPGVDRQTLVDVLSVLEARPC